MPLGLTCNSFHRFVGITIYTLCICLLPSTNSAIKGEPLTMTIYFPYYHMTSYQPSVSEATQNRQVLMIGYLYVCNHQCRQSWLLEYILQLMGHTAVLYAVHLYKYTEPLLNAELEEFCYPLDSSYDNCGCLCVL